MKKTKVVLKQDDCAPDSMEFFEQEFQDMFSIEWKEWLRLSKKTENDNDYVIERTDGEIIASCSADSPYWEIETIIE